MTSLPPRIVSDFGISCEPSCLRAHVDFLRRRLSSNKTKNDKSAMKLPRRVNSASDAAWQMWGFLEFWRISVWNHKLAHVNLRRIPPTVDRQSHLTRSIPFSNFPNSFWVLSLCFVRRWRGYDWCGTKALTQERKQAEKEAKKEKFEGEGRLE